MEKPKFDIENFISDSKDILNELLNNQTETEEEVLIDGNIEDLLKLPMNEHYKNNQERLKRETEIKNNNIEIKSNINL